MKTLGVRIVVLNYCGAELLPQCLPSIVRAAERAAHPTRVTVLNNPSGVPDDGSRYVRENFPNVELFQARENRILCSYNDYLPLIQEPVVILLNNDIRVAEDFVDPLAQHFQEDPKMFMVAPRVMSFDGAHNTAGASRAGIRFGLFWCEARYPDYEKDLMTPSRTYSSGFGAFSREKFLELGGYDDRYLPGIMEDVDLCYRADKAGYACYYEPASVVYHLGQASFKKKFGAQGTDTLAHRNTFLFMWKNMCEPGIRLRHLFFLPLRLLLAVLRGHWAFIRGFRDALQKQRALHKS